MAIATTTISAFPIGDTYWVVQKHTTPGTDENDVDSGMPYVFGVWGVGSDPGNAGDNTSVIFTSNASLDDGTASLGHFCLHAEADEPVYTLAIGKHK